MTRDEQLDYLAGFFDGDGSLTSYARPGVYGVPAHFRYSRTASVQIIRRSVPEIFLVTFGGSVRHVPPRTGKRRATWVWALTLSKESRFFVAMRPRLILKREAVEVMCAICARLGVRWSRKPGFVLPPLETAQRLALVAKLDACNRAANSVEHLDGYTGRPSLPYLAGLLDAEGSVSTHRNTNSRGRAIVITVSNKCNAILEVYKRHFGGQVRDGSSVRQWVASATIAKLVLEQLSPYLIIKKEQAECALALWNVTAGRSRNLSKESVEKIVALSGRIRELNASRVA